MRTRGSRNARVHRLRELTEANKPEASVSLEEQDSGNGARFEWLDTVNRFLLSFSYRAVVSSTPHTRKERQTEGNKPPLKATLAACDYFTEVDNSCNTIQLYIYIYAF